MNERNYPSDLTNEEFGCIKDLIPKAKSGGRRRTLNMREVLDAIFFITKGGVQWRMLPINFPKWKSVYDYFRQWRINGVWQRIHDTLRALVREKEGRHKHPTAGCLDSQSVKTTEVADDVRGYDAGKKVKGRARAFISRYGGFNVGNSRPRRHRFQTKPEQEKFSKECVGCAKNCEKYG